MTNKCCETLDKVIYIPGTFYLYLHKQAPDSDTTFVETYKKALNIDDKNEQFLCETCGENITDDLTEDQKDLLRNEIYNLIP